MNGANVTARLDLPSGRTTGVHDGKGLQVRVLKGALWLTQEGDKRDFFVSGGESFTIERDGITVLHALAPTEVRVERRRRPRWQVWGRLLARYFIAVGMNRAVTRGVYRL